MHEYKPPLRILMLDGTCLMHTIDIVLGMWLDTKKWTLAHDGRHRYGWMTTNIAKCINGVLKGARMLSINALHVEYILMDPEPIDHFVLYNTKVHRSSLIWEGNDPGELHCQHRETSFYRNSVLDVRIIPYFSGSTCLDWREVCATLLGVVPEDRDISGQRLRLTWLTEHFPSLEPDADVESVHCYARAFILRLIEVTGTYSWGSAYLSWLYREIFPFITPMRLHSALHDGVLPQPPLSMRDEFCTTSTPMHVLPQYKYLLDRLMPEQSYLKFNCKLYGSYISMMSSRTPRLLYYCLDYFTLICFYIVEWHKLDRVLR
ncbi:hypothetical protein AAG906_039326 [Vitis piasezkii]